MTLFVTHRDCLLHEMEPGHPECPERMHAIEDRLLAAGLLDHLQIVEAPRATREQLLRVHSGSMIDRVYAQAPAAGIVHLDGDTAMNPHSLTAALYAAGALVRATDSVIAGPQVSAFCNVRPPGHHAERERSMGFCLFNNVAVGVAHALHQHRLARVAVVDFDVHHGNGTEDIFLEDGRVMLCSSFQSPYYPYHFRDSIPGHLINVPLAPGSDGAAFRRAVTQQWFPALRAFRPELIYISAGFDAHIEDPLAHLRLTEDDYSWVTRELMAIAADTAQQRIVSTLEGGYALSAVGRSAAAHIRTLMGL